jgi:hypothetical protein
MASTLSCTSIWSSVTASLSYTSSWVSLLGDTLAVSRRRKDREDHPSPNPREAGIRRLAGAQGQGAVLNVR